MHGFRIVASIVRDDLDHYGPVVAVLLHATLVFPLLNHQVYLPSFQLLHVLAEGLFVVEFNSAL